MNCLEVPQGGKGEKRVRAQTLWKQKVLFQHIHPLSSGGGMGKRRMHGQSNPDHQDERNDPRMSCRHQEQCKNSTCDYLHKEVFKLGMVKTNNFFSPSSGKPAIFIRNNLCSAQWECGDFSLTHSTIRVHALKRRTPPGPFLICGVVLKQYPLQVTLHLITCLKDLAKSDFSNTKQIL